MDLMTRCEFGLFFGGRAAWVIGFLGVWLFFFGVWLFFLGGVVIFLGGESHGRAALRLFSMVTHHYFCTFARHSALFHQFLHI
jgi:hypothetical protein